MSIRTLTLTAALAAILSLGACTTHVQKTSGADYLARYDQSKSYNSQSSVAATSIDADIYEIASVEPDLQFPARFGLARIENGQLTTLPGDESQLWQDMAERDGHRYGEFIPVSPIVTAMVAKRSQDRAFNVVDDIRRGAARQHLDYVLVYEVSNQNSRTKNDLSFTDATILGLFLMPSRKVKVDSAASAILLDVRNGYPYVTSTTFAENSATTTKASSGSKRMKLEDKGRVEAVRKLSGEIETALRDLKDHAYEQLAAQGY